MQNGTVAEEKEGGGAAVPGRGSRGALEGVRVVRRSVLVRGDAASAKQTRVDSVRIESFLDGKGRVA